MFINLSAFSPVTSFWYQACILYLEIIVDSWCEVMVTYGNIWLLVCELSPIIIVIIIIIYKTWDSSWLLLDVAKLLFRTSKKI